MIMLVVIIVKMLARGFVVRCVGMTAHITALVVTIPGLGGV